MLFYEDEFGTNDVALEECKFYHAEDIMFAVKLDHKKMSCREVRIISSNNTKII